MTLLDIIKEKIIDSRKEVLLSPHFEELSCSGSAYDMGLQQGRRFKHKILKNEKVLQETELFRKFVPNFIPLPFLLNTAKRIIPIFAPSVLSDEKDISLRLNGIADGAGVDRDLIFLAQALEIILAHIPYNVGCTTIAITPDKFTFKEPVILRNFDFLNNFRVFSIIRKSSPSGKIPNMGLTFTSIAGVHTGMNKAGLTFSYNYGYSKEAVQAKIPLTCYIQSALDQFENTEQALNFFLNKHFAAGAILTICDAQGFMVTIEGSPSKKALRYPDKNGLIVNTNCYTSLEMQGVNIPKEAFFDKNMPYGLDKVRVHESNEKRAKYTENLLNCSDRVSVDTLFKVLADHGEDDNAYDNCACRHIPIFHTIASAIMFPKRKAAYLLIGSPCKNKYHKYQL